MKKVLLMIILLVSAICSQAQTKDDTIHLALKTSQWISLVNQLKYYHEAVLTSKSASADVQDARAATEHLFPALTPMEADTTKKITVIISPKKKTK